MAYAHTRIEIGADVDPPVAGTVTQVGIITKRHYIEVNDQVTQEKLGVDDATWEIYYRDGVVGDEKLPTDEFNHEEESFSHYKTRKALEELEEASARPETPRQRRQQEKK